MGRRNALSDYHLLFFFLSGMPHRTCQNTEIDFFWKHCDVFRHFFVFSFFNVGSHVKISVGVTKQENGINIRKNH